MAVKLISAYWHHTYTLIPLSKRITVGRILSSLGRLAAFRVLFHACLTYFINCDSVKVCLSADRLFRLFHPPNGQISTPVLKMNVGNKWANRSFYRSRSFLIPKLAQHGHFIIHPYFPLYRSVKLISAYSPYTYTLIPLSQKITLGRILSSLGRSVAFGVQKTGMVNKNG